MSDQQSQESPRPAPVAKCDECGERAVSACLQCRDMFCMFHAIQHRTSEEGHTLQDLVIPQRRQQQYPDASPKHQTPAKGMKRDKSIRASRKDGKRQPTSSSAHASRPSMGHAAPIEELGEDWKSQETQCNQQQGPSAHNLHRHQSSVYSEGSKGSKPAQSKATDRQKRGPADRTDCESVISSDSGISGMSSDLSMSSRDCDVCFKKCKAVKKCITCNDVFCEICAIKHSREMYGHQLHDLAPSSISSQKDSPGKIQFSVGPDSVTLKWHPPEGAIGYQSYKVTWTSPGQAPRSIPVQCLGAHVTGLSPGQRYDFTVSTASEDGCESPYLQGYVQTEIPPPQNLSVDLGASSISLSWTKPARVDQVFYLLELFREQICVNTIHSDDPHYTITDLKTGQDYTIKVSTVVTNGKRSKPISKTFRVGPGFPEFLSALGLKDLYGGKLTLSSALEINSNTVSDTPAENLKELPQTFLNGLMLGNINVRNIRCVQPQHYDHSFSENNESDALNPLDLITALFHCADPFLQQELVSKMSMCQFAVPLLLPNCDTQQSMLMLWAMRDLVKKFRPQSVASEKAFVEGRIVEKDIPMVSFVRLGESSLAKSQTLNKLLSNPYQQNNAFVHHNMECGDVPRRISDGLVEVSWYLPSGKGNTDIFTEPVAMANLRGDGMLFKTQISFLCQTSAAVFIFSDDLQGDLSTLTNKRNKAKLFLVSSSQSKNFNIDTLMDICRRHNIKDKHMIIKKRQNDAEFVKTLRSCVSAVIEKKSAIMRMVDMAVVARQAGIQVDEDCSECVKGKRYAKAISSSINDIANFKVEHLPLHGQMWKEISQVEEEMFRMKKIVRGQVVKQYRAILQKKVSELRKKQYQTDISEAMTTFTEGISQSKVVRLYFLKWLKIQLDNLCLQNREQQKKQSHRIPQARGASASLTDEMPNCTLGLEHFLRELGQLYECACSLPENKRAKQQVQHLPALCAQMLLDGCPVELVDGDASNIPVKWISEVLNQLHQLVDSKSTILVLTVLGVQGTGKSTLLNTMFGVQFAVSSGASTRGAFMQLIKVSEELRTELKCDFIMAINTEGLKSAELAAVDSNYEHDNELATLVIGLSDITIINVAMENITEMKDILQIVIHAFLRMKEVPKKPRCVFVHQNMPDIPAHDSNKRDRKKLMEQLDEMTQVAGKMERKEGSTKFSNVMQHDSDKDNYYIPALWNGSQLMAPVNAGYSEAVCGFKKSLFDYIRTSDDIEMNDAIEFNKWTNILWNAVKSEKDVFNFKNSMVADAYNKLRAEFDKWVWSFRYSMRNWQSEQEKHIPRDRDLSTSKLAEILHEAAATMNKEVAVIDKNLEEYLAKNDSHTLLMQGYKEDFRNSLRRLRRETEISIEHALKRPVKTKEGLEIMKKIASDVIQRKIQDLQVKCRANRTFLTDEDLDSEFEKLWDVIIHNLSNNLIPAQDVCKRVLSVLLSHSKAKTGHAKVIPESSLQEGGLEKFTVNKQWLGKNRKHQQQIQVICDTVIIECESFVYGKVQRNACYKDADINDLLQIIEKRIKDHGLSEEGEDSLELHVCGHAVREFQKVHSRIGDLNDHATHLKSLKPNLQALFIRQYRRGECLV